MLHIYRWWALCCVVQAPFCFLLLSEGRKEGYHVANIPLYALYVAGSLSAAFHVPFVLSAEAPAALPTLCFWTHVVCVEFLFQASSLHDSTLWLLLSTIRSLSLLTVCAAARGSPRLLWCVNGSTYLVCLVHVMIHSEGLAWRLLLVGQAFLDALLVLAHKWDAQEEEDVEKNAHLFYLAVSSSLMHVGYIVGE